MQGDFYNKQITFRACLGEFIAENASLWKGASILELGAGAGALPSVTAIKCGGAQNVWISDQGGLDQVICQKDF